MKCVMIIDKALPIGLIANTAAVLGSSLSHHVSGLIGPDISYGGSGTHKGVTTVPFPILAMGRNGIKEIHDRVKSENSEDITVIGFNTVAQKSKSCEEYTQKLNNMDPGDLNYLGICLWGPKKLINRLCGSIAMLK